MKKYLIGLIIIIIGFTTIVFAQGFQAQKASFPIFINGQKFESDKPIVVIDGSTYIPLKAISEVLGVNASWNAEKKQVEIGNSNIYKVTRIVDGDTFKIDYNGREETVRLIGVDTPESVHPDATKNTEFGKQVSAYTKSQLEGKEVRLEFDVGERDRYGRLLAYVYIDDIFYNAELVKKGYAQVMTISPNVKHSELFTALQEEARKNKVGMWGFEQNQNTEQTSQTSGKYVGSKESNKYHKLDCIWVQKITDENKVYFDSITEAEKAGYFSCDVCKPE